MPSRETDIFMVFETTQPNPVRFAVHVENKPGGGRFREGQAADYEPRAKHMLNKAEFLNHTDFVTILIATSDFRERFREECDLLQEFIPYEKIAAFLPQFGP